MREVENDLEEEDGDDNGDEETEWWVPHPASASQFSTAAGSHPRF